MYRPLETPFWARVKLFLKGVFFYNTIYWRRASDDLEIRHMSREERASLRPKRDFEFIRPRGTPRPAAPAVTTPPPRPAVVRSAPPVLRTPAPRTSAPRTPVSPPAQLVAGEEETAERGWVEIQRRRRRRRSRQRGGMFGWLFDE